MILFTDCKYLNKDLSCQNKEVARMLGARLKTCVLCISEKDVCGFKKPHTKKNRRTK